MLSVKPSPGKLARRVESVTVTSTPPPKRFKVKAWHVLFLTILVLATLSLAWWQWTRFRSGSGTFQNLGYAFQWPCFGAFFVFAYRKILEYENEKYAMQQEAEETAETSGYVAPKIKEQAQSSVIDEQFLPQRPQMSVEEFNELNQQRRRR